MAKAGGGCLGAFALMALGALAALPLAWLVELLGLASFELAWPYLSLVLAGQGIPLVAYYMAAETLSRGEWGEAVQEFFMAVASQFVLVGIGLGMSNLAGHVPARLLTLLVGVVLVTTAGAVVAGLTASRRRRVESGFRESPSMFDETPRRGYFDE